jgi:ketosteroid isomerase-like protein
MEDEMTNSSVARPADLVKSQYENLSQGNIEAVLTLFDDDVEFRLAEGHPYQPSGRPWFGKPAVLEHFFKRGAGEWEGWRVVIETMLELGEDLVVECRYVGTYKPTGKAFDIQVCHIWKFQDGKARVFHQYIDTARLQDVMRT